MKIITASMIIHYDENAKSAPVVNGATINIKIILMLMAG
jgi:hypothetical protein